MFPFSLYQYLLNLIINMLVKKFIAISTNYLFGIRHSFTENSSKSPIIYSNGNSIFSLAQWWDGSAPRPTDYYVHDSLSTEITQDWKLQDGLFRVLFSVNLSDPSMNININHLKKSKTLNQLIQLSANQKEQLVQNPSTVIIEPFITENEEDRQDQIQKNMLQLDKLLQDGVGLKTSFLINAQNMNNVKYIAQLKRRNKAICANIAKTTTKIEEVIFNHGYKLEHIFLNSFIESENKKIAVPFKFQFDLKPILSVLTMIDFKGKIILPGGQHYQPALQLFMTEAKAVGFTPKLQFQLGTDGWYTML